MLRGENLSPRPNSPLPPGLDRSERNAISLDRNHIEDFGFVPDETASAYYADRAGHSYDFQQRLYAQHDDTPFAQPAPSYDEPLFAQPQSYDEPLFAQPAQYAQYTPSQYALSYDARDPQTINITPTTTNPKSNYPDLNPPLRLESPGPDGRPGTTYQLDKGQWKDAATKLADIRTAAGKAPLKSGWDQPQTNRQTKGAQALREAYTKGMNIRHLRNITEDAQEKRQQRQEKYRTNYQQRSKYEEKRKNK